VTTEGTDAQQAIAALEAKLAATPRGTHPYEHGALAYRLGLARAESPVGDPRENLRHALACYEVAAAVFDPRFDPVEHARALNAAGAAQRGLGQAARARELFQRAADLLEVRGRDDERAAALNNLGLVCSEDGAVADALRAFDAAWPLFDDTSPEGRRGRMATFHNRGLAQASPGTAPGFEAALEDYERARAAASDEEAPYHHGMLHHSVGLATLGLAALVPETRERRLQEAIEAFDASLQVFTRGDFPFQYALARHNLGRALASTGELANLRRALVGCEEAVATLDPRLHPDPWRHAHSSLEAIEAELRQHGAEGTRAAHFVTLAAQAGPAERRSLLRERLTRLAALPPGARDRALGELAVATTHLPEALLRSFVEAEIGVLMELPNDALEAALAARVDAHRQLPEPARLAADTALDLAVADALGLSQRILVRDHLMSLGFERP
jgi:tetratricopeptide (TPR) repeat protein